MADRNVMESMYHSKEKGVGGREERKDPCGEYKRFEKGNMCNAAQRHQLLTQVFEKMQWNDKNEMLESKK